MNDFLICSDLKLDAGMESSRSISTLSATADAVSRAAGRMRNRKSLLGGLFTAIEDKNRQEPRIVDILRDPKEKNIFRRYSFLFETLLAPPEAMRRFGIAVDRPVPIDYARWKSEQLRQEQSDRAFIARSASKVNDLKNFLISRGVDKAEDVVIDKIISLLPPKVGVPAKGLKEIYDVSNDVIDVLEFVFSDPALSSEPVAIKPKVMPPWARSLEHMSAEQRADLLDQTSAALLSGQLPQHDQILLMMRLLDQDNEINRRPPNSGFAGPIQ